MNDAREHVTALVIGAGPAGLMAAEVLSAAGKQVLIIDAKPSIGRKFLMAGKSGLNLTRLQDLPTFTAAYSEAAEWLSPMLKVFGPEQVQHWAEGLGQPVFAGSTGRVFPETMKASPLLRAWVGRLNDAGVQFRTRWQWLGWDGDATVFETPDGPRQIQTEVTILALGGASWARLGSNGLWADTLQAQVVDLAPFEPANAGLRVDWHPAMARHFGQPVKSVALQVGGETTRGEFVISSAGLEGGGIYALTRQIREGLPLTLDLLPDWSDAKLLERLAVPRGKASMSNFLRKTLKLDPARLALLQEFGRPIPNDPQKLADLVRALPIAHAGVRPMDEAISTAGGVTRNALSEGLMLLQKPGVFCVGEMLDWEAPTGGYLLTGCLATGRWAALAALERLASPKEVSSDVAPPVRH